MKEITEWRRGLQLHELERVAKGRTDVKRKGVGLQALATALRTETEMQRRAERAGYE
jgi:hypothetical protein